MAEAGGPGGAESEGASAIAGRPGAAVCGAMAEAGGPGGAEPNGAELCDAVARCVAGCARSASIRGKAVGHKASPAQCR